MSRKRSAPKKIPIIDPVYKSTIIPKLINSIMYDGKKTVAERIVYDAINKILNKNKILSPKLLNQNYRNNYIEVEDFGDNTLYKVLKNNKTNKDLIFRKILKTLRRLQLIKDK